jgi:hypothetical protein
MPAAATKSKQIAEICGTTPNAPQAQAVPAAPQADLPSLPIIPKVRWATMVIDAANSHEAKP